MIRLIVVMVEVIFNEVFWESVTVRSIVHVYPGLSSDQYVDDPEINTTEASIVKEIDQFLCVTKEYIVSLFLTPC